jgi:hypothetical protein
MLAEVMVWWRFCDVILMAINHQSKFKSEIHRIVLSDRCESVCESSDSDGVATREDEQPLANFSFKDTTVTKNTQDATPRNLTTAHDKTK